MRIVASVQRTTRGWRGIRWVDKKCTQRLNVALRQFERNDGWGNGEKDMGDFPPLSLVRSPPSKPSVLPIDANGRFRRKKLAVRPLYRRTSVSVDFRNCPVESNCQKIVAASVSLVGSESHRGKRDRRETSRGVGVRVGTGSTCESHFPHSPFLPLLLHLHLPTSLLSRSTVTKPASFSYRTLRPLSTPPPCSPSIVSPPPRPLRHRNCLADGRRTRGRTSPPTRTRVESQGGSV